LRNHAAVVRSHHHLSNPPIALRDFRSTLSIDIAALSVVNAALFIGNNHAAILSAVLD